MNVHGISPLGKIFSKNVLFIWGITTSEQNIFIELLNLKYKV